MMPFFGKSSKSPSEVVKNLKDSLGLLEKMTEESGKKYDKAQDDVSKYLLVISSLLFNCDTDQQSDIILAQMSQEMYNSQLFPNLLRNLDKMEFEARKEAAEIFKHVLKRQIGTRTPTVEYICTCDEILITLCRGYKNPEICHITGRMLRECLVYESLAKIVLTSESFNDFFKFVEDSQFDIAADAFSSFRDILTRHKTTASQYIEANNETFFMKFNCLLISDNFVTKLNSLKLLNDLLVDRNNLKVMKKYIQKEENLKLTMSLLLDQHKAIQATSVDIFKLFLLNPQKSEGINSILKNNQELLIKYFENLSLDDPQLENKRRSLLEKIKSLDFIER